MADPRQIERRYQAALVRMVRGVTAIIRDLLFAELDRTPSADSVHSDAMPGDLAELIARVRAQSEAGVVSTIESLEDFAERTSGFSRAQFQRSVRQAFGVDILAAEPALNGLVAEWSARNASLITSIRDTLLDQVAEVTREAFGAGLSTEQTKTRIAERFEVSESRAKLIARDQIATLNGQMTQARNEKLGISQYEWATAGDERVRETHTPLNGKICRWDDNTVYRDQGSDEWRPRSEIGAVELHPGEDIQCRCTSFAIVEI